MLRRLGMVAITGLLAAGCSGTSTTPDRPAPTAPTAKQCPSPAIPTAPAKNDMVFSDPETCDQAVLGDIARVAQKELQRSYEVKLVPPTQSFTCVRLGKPAPVNGSTTTALAFCDGNKVFVVTAPGVKSRIPGTKIVYIWYVIANESASVRFSLKTQQVCAAGYIAGKRPNAIPSDDLKAMENVAITDWKTPAKPWQYIAFGYKLARDGKGIEGCDKPQPVAAPSAS